MEIRERHEDGVTILDLEGQLTLGDPTRMLKREVDRLVELGIRRVVLDLEKVPYIDSTGLGEIVRSHTTLARRGGELRITNMNEKVHKLFALTRIALPGVEFPVDFN